MSTRNPESSLQGLSANLLPLPVIAGGTPLHMGCGINRSVRALDLEPLTAWPQGWGGVKLKNTPLAPKDFFWLIS